MKANLAQIVEDLKEQLLTACGSSSCCNAGNKPIQITYKGKIITFCVDDCRQEFLENPEKFINSDHMKIEFDRLPTDLEEDMLFDTH